MEKLHLDVSADRKWLWELKQHHFVFPPGVGGVRRMDLYLQLVHHKLRIWTAKTTTPELFLSQDTDFMNHCLFL